jgi:hypothetical protein
MHAREVDDGGHRENSRGTTHVMKLRALEAATDDDRPESGVGTSEMDSMNFRLLNSYLTISC